MNSDPLFVPFVCKDNVSRSLDISSHATGRFGLTYQQAIITPSGPGHVVGVDYLGDLYIQVEGDMGPTTWSNCRNADDMKRLGFTVVSQDYGDSHMLNHAGLATEYHNVKRVNLPGGVERCIVMQTHNGPCPVIALVNALILKGELTDLVPPGSSVVAALHLRSKLLAFLREARAPPKCNGRRNRSDHCTTLADVIHDPNGRLEQIRNSLLSRDDAKGDRLLHKFYGGLDVNPFFDDPDGFECNGDSNAVLLFALGGIRLVHGWLFTNPDHPRAALASYSYDQVTTSLAFDENHPLSSLARTMIEEPVNQQLTEAGLEALRQTLDEDEIAVLFFNNHFATVVLHQQRLCMLASDVSFVDRSCIVFQAIDDAFGNVSFLNGGFEEPDRFLLNVQAAVGDQFSEQDILLTQAQLFSESDGMRPVEARDVIDALQRRRSNAAATVASPSPAAIMPLDGTSHAAPLLIEASPHPPSPIVDNISDDDIRQVMDICQVDREVARNTLSAFVTVEAAIDHLLA